MAIYFYAVILLLCLRVLTIAMITSPIKKKKASWLEALSSLTLLGTLS